MFVYELSGCGFESSFSHLNNVNIKSAEFSELKIRRGYLICENASKLEKNAARHGEIQGLKNGIINF